MAHPSLSFRGQSTNGNRECAQELYVTALDNYTTLLESSRSASETRKPLAAVLAPSPRARSLSVLCRLPGRFEARRFVLSGVSGQPGSIGGHSCSEAATRAGKRRLLFAPWRKRSFQSIQAPWEMLWGLTLECRARQETRRRVWPSPFSAPSHKGLLVAAAKLRRWEAKHLREPPRGLPPSPQPHCASVTPLLLRTGGPERAPSGWRCPPCPAQAGDACSAAGRASISTHETKSPGP